MNLFYSLLISILLCIDSYADNTLNNYISSVKPEVIKWRRYLHQYPELSGQEFNTAKFIAEKLQSFGIEVRAHVARTGVVGILRGEKPGPVVGLRADMDALPLHENTNLPFASTATAYYLGKKVPVMHACGHDSHVAILLGAAKILSQMKKDLAGTVVFIFQPAEEGTPLGESGASMMIKEGVLDHPKIEAMFGLHINANLEVGNIVYKQGAFQASADYLFIKIKGKPTHAAMPWLGVDPIVIGAQVINSLQTIVSRHEDLSKAPVVITIGTINAGIRSNVIPENLTMTGTIRTLDSGMQKDIHERIKQMVSKIAEASNGLAEIKIIPGTLINYNNPSLTEKMLPSLQKSVSINHVKEISWIMPAEDFSFYSAKIPTLFFNIGGMKKGTAPEKSAPHHTADFYIDESGFEVGIKAFCQLVFDYAKLKN